MRAEDALRGLSEVKESPSDLRSVYQALEALLARVEAHELVHLFECT
jgi:hypothetical protein